jgi:hypothetical protein
MTLRISIGWGMIFCFFEFFLHIYEFKKLENFLRYLTCLKKRMFLEVLFLGSNYLSETKVNSKFNSLGPQGSLNEFSPMFGFKVGHD